MLGDRPMEEWIAQYAQSHQNPVNRALHTVGIPMIASSLLLMVVALVARRGWRGPLVLFVVGWVFQFVGHYYEGKPPEFFSDWRFLLVGLRWWFAKVQGRA